jgi:hypothetical protein
MKKSLVLATGMALLTNVAYATKARMTALGQSAQRGSYYLADTRNIFQNPADLNNTKNYAVIEAGTEAGTIATAAAGTNTEGGFFKEMGNFVYGVYLGSDMNNQTQYRGNAAGNGYAGTAGGFTEANFLQPDGEVDLFFAGDAGLQWGARVHYVSQSADTALTDTAGNKMEKKHNGLNVGLGVVWGDIGGWANITLNDKSEGANDAGDKWEGENLNLGASYVWKDFTFYVDYETLGGKYTNQGGTTTPETTNQVIYLGFGHIHEASSSARINTDLTVRLTENEDKAGGATPTITVKRTEVPLTVGVEADALDWLTLRASVVQNLPFLNSVKTEGNATATNNGETTAGNTSINAGLTFNYGKLQVDYALGIGTTGALQFGNAFATNMAMHYWF